MYVEGRDTAEKVMAVAGRKQQQAASGSPARRRPAAAAQAPAETFLEGAMAVYLDRRGRPFAWQIPFDISEWDRVTALIGPL